MDAGAPKPPLALNVSTPFLYSETLTVKTVDAPPPSVASIRNVAVPMPFGVIFRCGTSPDAEIPRSKLATSRPEVCSTVTVVVGAGLALYLGVV